MKVFKFGGASVKDAAAVRNMTAILKMFSAEELVVVISAMGKTTNALEKVTNAYFSDISEAPKNLDVVKKYHLELMEELFPDKSHQVYNLVNNLFVEIEWVLEESPSRSYAFVYDQIVSAGELISTTIISNYLNASGVSNTWLDARDCIQTDNNYREGNVDWELTQDLTRSKVEVLFKKNKIVITQGFIGGTSENFTTTLGREGSDYSAAIFAYCMNADGVFIWKDVPGVLNADPKFYKEAQKLERMSYHDAIELAYYGASVIHPKTIKPLENKNIALHVKSFVNPDLPGTVIGKDFQTKPLIPSFIFKENQVLISIAAKDFSFIAEENLSGIFGLFARLGVKINLMQNSAISFSVCIDNDALKTPELIKALMNDYKVRYNENLQLFTVRHYYPSTIEMLTTGKEILLEQRSRQTAQFVVRTINN
ncbi:MAG: aspartate kinase [Bacteroidetes bacterium]|nr:aspartate kinase [Bacteroidota bacterium]MBK9424478.1 aspartate kinase [Bacteroidota bacterium]